MMSSQPTPYKLKISQQPKTYVDGQLTPEELETVYNELKRIASLPNPVVDILLDPIKLTNNLWYRAKKQGERWRAIVYIDKSNREIVLLAIIVRTDDTYSKIVKDLWDEWEG